MSIVRIKVGPGSAKVFSPFDAKELIKSMPTRSWSPGEKCWVIPAYDVDDLKAVLEEAGYHVFVTREARQQEQRQRQHQPPPRNGYQNAGTWADQLYTALGPTLGEKAFRALVRVVHPDTGGSTVLMQELNAARDRYGVRR